MLITELNKNEFVFINVPTIYKNFKIVQYGYAGTYIMETDSTTLNHWQISIKPGKYEIIGFIDTDVTDKNFALKIIK